MKVMNRGPLLLLLVISSSLALSCSAEAQGDGGDDMGGKEFAAYLGGDIKSVASRLEQMVDFIAARKANPNTPAKEKECLNKCEQNYKQYMDTRKELHLVNGADLRITIEAVRATLKFPEYCSVCFDDNVNIEDYVKQQKQNPPKKSNNVAAGVNLPGEPKPNFKVSHNPGQPSKPVAMTSNNPGQPGKPVAMISHNPGQPGKPVAMTSHNSGQLGKPAAMTSHNPGQPNKPAFMTSNDDESANSNLFKISHNPSQPNKPIAMTSHNPGQPGKPVAMTSHNPGQPSKPVAMTSHKPGQPAIMTSNNNV